MFLLADFCMQGLDQGGNTPHVIEAKIYIIAYGKMFRMEKCSVQKNVQ